jgi:hypothetical protein
MAELRPSIGLMEPIPFARGVVQVKSGGTLTLTLCPGSRR